MPIKVVGTSMMAKAIPNRAANSASQCNSRFSIQTWPEVTSAPSSGMLSSVEAAMPTCTHPKARRGSWMRASSSRTMKLPSAMPTRKAVSMVTNA